MKHSLIASALLMSVGLANASVTLVGGTERHFTGFDAPPVLTAPQSTGLEDALLVSDNPLDRLTATFLGKEATHVNQFYVNGALVFDNLATAPSTYGNFAVGTPMNFSFRDVNDGTNVDNGGNTFAFASYVVLGTFGTDGSFNAYKGEHGEFDYVLGFNDGLKIDADFDDLVVGVNVAAVPEPETYALMLAGLGVVGFVARRRRRA
jgi:hypothetical protein